MPEKLARDQFAADAAQKLGIDSAVLREELRQAALKRRDHVEARAAALTEVERVLLRALAITDPENERARRLAAAGAGRQPAWFEHLGTFGAAGAGRAAGTRPHGRGGGRGAAGAAGRGAAGRDEAARGGRGPERHPGDSGAGDEHRQRELRALIAEAERRGDFAELAVLTQQKLELDRALRQLHHHRPPEG